MARENVKWLLFGLAIVFLSNQYSQYERIGVANTVSNVANYTC